MKQLPDVAASNDLSRKLLSDVEAMVQLCNSGGMIWFLFAYVLQQGGKSCLRGRRLAR